MRGLMNQREIAQHGGIKRMLRAQPFGDDIRRMLQGGAGCSEVAAIPLRFGQAEQGAGVVERGSLGIPAVEIDRLLKQLLTFRRMFGVDEAAQISERGADGEGIGAENFSFQIERFPIVGFGRREVA